MRAVFYGHCARLSGAEIALLNTVPNLSSFDPTVVLGEDGPLVDAFRERGVSTRVVPLPETVREFSRRRVGLGLAPVRRVLETLRYVVRIRRELRRLDPDVILSNTMKGHVIVGAATLGMRTPTVYYVRDRIVTDFMSPQGVRLMRGLLGRRARFVLANSEATLATVPTTARHLARAAITSPIVEPGHAERRRAADRPASGAPLVLGMVGRITEWKGQALLLEAFARADLPTSARLEFAGDALFGETEYLDRLHRDVERLGLQDRVVFLGHVSDVYAAMSSWDVVVHASTIPEPFGQVVVQGMAMGLPVIAAREGGPLEVITHEVDGLLAEPRSIESLTALVERLERDPAERARLGAAALRTSQAYLVGPVTARFETFLVEAVRSGRRTR